MSDTSSAAEELLAGARQTLLKVPGSHPKYKEAYSQAAWSVFEQVMEDHNRQTRQMELVHDALKLSVNQSQLALAGLRQLERDFARMDQTIKALPAPKVSADAAEAEGTDHKGE
jgi:hypothetical protein